MSEQNEDLHADAVEAPPAYMPPALRVLGSVHDLTQGCDKRGGKSDGFTFMGQAIVCRSV